MDVISKHISLTARGRLYGFGKANTSRLHRTSKPPPELRTEQLPNGRYYVVAPPRNDARCVVYARWSPPGTSGRTWTGRRAGWLIGPPGMGTVPIRWSRRLAPG